MSERTMNNSELSRESLKNMRWSAEDIREYLSSFGPIVGCNYIPAYCYNYVQMLFDFKENVIRRELGFAKEAGVNSLRIFIPLFAFQKEELWPQVKENLRRFIDLIAKLDMTVTIAFQPDYVVISDEGSTEPEVDFHPGRQIRHWRFKDTGIVLLSEHPELYPVLNDFYTDVLDTFGLEKEILMWDLWNEADAADAEPMEYIFSCARAIVPSQPLTACWEAEDLCDVITFHSYSQPGAADENGYIEFDSSIAESLAFGRPVICTECLARSYGSTFENILPFFKAYHIGFYFWGLCAGSAQYHFPWGWPEGAPEPRKWFHCIMYPDGTAYDDAEIRLLQKFDYA